MRMIRFRAWQKEQKKMYSPETMSEDQLTLMPDGRGFANISSTSTRLSAIDNNKRMIPLQYTGLQDKNGREIYEGDIIRDIEKLTWQVLYNESEACFDIQNMDKKSRLQRIHLHSSFEDLEVIGNIYENPELIKGDKNERQNK